jgi:hypothetical protein
MTHHMILNKMRVQAEAGMLEAIESLSPGERSEQLERAHERGVGTEFVQTVAIAELAQIVADQQARIEALEGSARGKRSKKPS